MKTNETIKRLLKERKISQKELAKRIGKSQTAVSQILKGNYNPNPETMNKISNVLNVPIPVISYLSLDRNDVPDNKKQLFDILNPSVNNLINEIFEFDSVSTKISNSLGIKKEEANRLIKIALKK
jgi:XRE family transcriptional regulator, regulator of sulfur utilization